MIDFFLSFNGKGRGDVLVTGCVFGGLMFDKIIYMIIMNNGGVCMVVYVWKQNDRKKK